MLSKHPISKFVAGPEHKVTVLVPDDLPILDEDIIFAYALSDSNIFTKRIEELRKSLNLEKKYPRIVAADTTVIELEELVDKLLTEETEAYRLARMLCDTYALPRNWAISFMATLVSWVLPVPYSSPIKLYAPFAKDDSLLAEFKRDGLNSGDSLVIEISSELPLTELISYLKTNKKTYKKAASLLPKSTRTKTELKSLKWGRWAFLLRNRNPDMSWGELFDLFYSMVKDDLDSGELEDLPTDATDLRHAYIAYVNFIESLEIRK